MARALKVFRTAAGFHDAYVAAPSRKAALAAWGADADLFARGVAEEVIDAALMEAPLAHPGEVVKVSRGSAAEQLAAVEGKPAGRRANAASIARKSRPAPKPSRDALDAAEAALADADHRYRAEDRALAAEQKALDRRKAAAAAAHGDEQKKLAAAVEQRRGTYDAALERWRK